MRVKNGSSSISYLLSLIFHLLSLSVPLFARDVAIIVRDADLGIPLEGATVRSWDGAEYVCGADGRAMVPVPDGRQVVVRVAYPGYENGRLQIPATGGEFFCGLRLGGVLENRELVIEASPPEASEARSGRSIAISGESLSRTSEIGFIEDVMSSIKLLPGVGYSSMFDAQPSIRGGDPGDLMAAMDGFYIESPYHWGGAYSIFVPQMVESAKLSHGVFSTRYGHTVSGLLEIVTRKPSPTETQFDLGVSTSETNLGLSFPLGGKGGSTPRGGVMAIGKVTYWDPFVDLAKLVARGVPELEIINSVTTAPFIRDFSITGNYRFSTDLELTATGFLGTDGVGAEYNNEFTNNDGDKREVDLVFDWLNYRALGIAGLTWSPRRDMVFRGSLGWGLYESDMIADIGVHLVHAERNPEEVPNPNLWDYLDSTRMDGEMVDTTITYQGRADFDWAPREGFLFAAGVQELYSQWIKAEHFRTEYTLDPEWETVSPDSFPVLPSSYPPLDTKNQGLATSAYSLLEYQGPAQRFGAELGLRVDHFYFIGRDFTIQTLPAINPRLNLDFGILKNRGIIDALSVTVGTGLFSSMNDAVSSIALSDDIGDFDLKPNRSWTSIVGLKLDFAEKLSFNIEGYYKQVFDRAYTVTTSYMGSNLYSSEDDGNETAYWFNGEGRVLGFDFILQKLESRFWDGWLSYSFTWAQYRNPDTVPDTLPQKEINGETAIADPNTYPITGNDWYYPSFHRYHNINLVLNFKPFREFNIATRFGFASGTPENDGTGARTGFSWPVDLKLSFYRFNPKGKVSTEIYLAAENLQALVYDAVWIARVNGYTGEEDPSEYKPVYDLPIPMISFGFKWRY